MTQEEKQLLLKDLSARLPYGVLAKPNKGVGFVPARVTTIIDYIDVKVTLDGSLVLPLDMVQPYLRPMSSMTEEESDEFEKITNALLEHGDSEEIWDTVIDWLNEHHFDHRHLIEKGLALEAPNGMYKED